MRHRALTQRSDSKAEKHFHAGQWAYRPSEFCVVSDRNPRLRIESSADATTSPARPTE